MRRADFLYLDESPNQRIYVNEDVITRINYSSDY